MHQVYYDANGATEGAAPSDLTAWAAGSEVTVLGNVGGMKNGTRVFSDWNTQTNGSGEAYAVGSKLQMADRSVTLYAQWKDRSSSTDLQVNELVSSWGAGTPIAIELWNPTSQTVNLSSYQLRSPARTNDSAATNVGLVTFDLPSLPISPGAYVVIRSRFSPDFASGGNTVYLDKTVATGVVAPWFSGSSDSVELLRDGITVDFVRWGSSAPLPSSTFAFDGAAPGFGSSGQSIGRDASGQFTPSASDWTERDWNTLGGPNDVTTDTDSDGDGLPDSAEVAGGSLAGLPLADWGARADRVDLFVHVDYMDKPGVPATAIPQKEALQKVVDRFAAHGIAVHFDVGDLYSSGVNPAQFNLDGRSHALAWSDSLSIGDNPGKANANQLRAASMPLAKTRSFFYLAFGNSQSYGDDVANGSGGSGGLAYVWGNVSIVTIGDWAEFGLTDPQEVINDQAATILHELGHNLGLRHGGFEDVNLKPNYLSIMNYLYAYEGIPAASTVAERYYFQLDQLAANQPLQAGNLTTYTDDATSTNFVIDLSNGSSTDLDESSIVESTGVGRTGFEGVDFNNDGSISSTGLPINLLQKLNPNEYYAPGSSTTSAWPGNLVLQDNDDWGHLNTVFQRSYSGLYGDRWRGAGVPWAPPPTVGQILTRPSNELSADAHLHRR